MSQIAFRATKGGTNQAGIPDNVATQVTFGTEVFDNGSHYAANFWTPPTGFVLVGAAARWTATVSSGLNTSLLIRKNSSNTVANQQQKSFTNSGGDYCYGYDQASGTDTYSVWLQADITSGTATVSGTVEDSYFFGLWFGNTAPASFMNVSNTVTVSRKVETVGY